VNVSVTVVMPLSRVKMVLAVVAVAFALLANPFCSPDLALAQSQPETPRGDAGSSTPGALSGSRATKKAAGTAMLRRPAPDPSRFVVRVGYVIPSDRRPQRGYEEAFEFLMSEVRRFYGVQLDRHGLGPWTFRLETEPTSERTAQSSRAHRGQGNGSRKLRIHVVLSDLTVEEMVGSGERGYKHNEYFDNVVAAARRGGLTPWSEGEVWLLVAETHRQRENGSIEHETAQGAGALNCGVAVLDGSVLVFADPRCLNDHQPYDGRVLEGLGEVALRSQVSFPWYEGRDVSSLSAAAIGAAAHELGHCFLLNHQYIHDDNFNGTLMGNGFRGWRGYAFPQRFPGEDARLDRGSALLLELNRFFRPLLTVSDTTPPVFEVQSSGRIDPVDGCVRIPFTASDAPGGSGLALALIENGTGRDGVGNVDYIEFPERPMRASGSFVTSRYSVDEKGGWRIRFFDGQCNVSEQIVNITVNPTGNRSPMPFIWTETNLVVRGQKAWFDGSLSRDPEGNALTFNWDFGDGSRGEGLRIDHLFEKSGVFEVSLTVTDQHGSLAQESVFVKVVDSL